MRLAELAGENVPGLLGVSPGCDDVEIAALAYDSRAAGPGSLFFCVPGLARDGHEFAAAAVASGAAALVLERSLGLGVPELLVESVRTVDFPVVEAAVFVTAVLVFGANSAVDLLLPAVDPRLRSRGA